MCNLRVPDAGGGYRTTDRLLQVNARYIHVAFHTVSSTYATAQVRVDVHLHTR